MESTYELRYSDRFLGDVAKVEKSGRKLDLKKVHRFIGEVKAHPRSGTGHPEQLRHHEVETWSRAVNEKDRFVYEIHEDEGLVIVKQALGHYTDK